MRGEGIGRGSGGIVISLKSVPVGVKSQFHLHLSLSRSPHENG